jgi:nucleolar GTP-binding protein
MDGKNIADFIDPDIAEKLEALEREEERLEAEGFYDADEDIFDSDDEREAAAAKSALGLKTLSQANKKNLKNQARLPRTAGLKTMSEMSHALTKAGLDPSRIEARAEILAKARTAERKRKRDDDDAEMDVDEAPELLDDGEMEVDGAERSPPKRAKANSGAVVTRAPRTNRQLAGFRDEEVGIYLLMVFTQYTDVPCSKRARRRRCETSASASGTARRRRARATARSRQKWYVSPSFLQPPYS